MSLPKADPKMAASVDAVMSLDSLGLTPEQQEWVKTRVLLGFIRAVCPR